MECCEIPQTLAPLHLKPRVERDLFVAEVVLLLVVSSKWIGRGNYRWLQSSAHKVKVQHSLRSQISLTFESPGIDYIKRPK